ncbi:(2Fe-2S)-binding protein [Psychromonas marina]|uniref:(2Fe-2S)-binding protein n=1 Tax=Psychromonas marina TaxID=88364 RepID=A0ABQ6E072_9GAMM|nr:MOSC N-terminal beta barrel domain-containing protein [Psychromonas marina]GLS90639.1 (2Fe-2S)-binding protein [Psychromonas marina]
MQALTDIYIYPIKSVKAISQPAAFVEEKGLSFDRRYMLIDLDGQFITGRTHPQLTQIDVQFSRKILQLNAPNMAQLSIDPEQFSTQVISADIWSDTVNALHCHQDYDHWFSTYLKQPCQLVFFAESSQRCIKDRDTSVAFADGYPLLLINQASIDQLNSKLESPVSALHFRPNIVIKGDFPFIEDSWLRIKIGEVEFEISKPCSRCTFINVDPKTGIPTDNEPLATLAKFRYHQGEIDFGQNLIPLNSGLIRAGDEVHVLATQEAISYTAQSDSLADNKKSLQIYYQQSALTVAGDNQQLLLDQAEQAGVPIPFSCRGGKCGRCKVQLIEGEVQTLNNEALSPEELEQGYILACSCIPLSDISLKH